MENMQKNIKVIWWIKSLLASYIVTGISLLVLTFFMYKFELNEKIVSAAIVGIYVVSTLNRRNDHRETDKIKTVLVGDGSWNHIFCIAFAHYTWSLQNSEWRQRKYCHITDTMCRRRYDRWYDIMKD